MILVVDDDAVHGDCVAEMLRRNGYAAESVSSAMEAMGRLEAGDVRAIVTDLLMPQTDGIELLCEVIRRHPGLTVIGMTGAHYKLRTCVERLMTILGARGLLPKPVDQTDLIAALDDTATLAAHDETPRAGCCRRTQ